MQVSVRFVPSRSSISVKTASSSVCPSVRLLLLFVPSSVRLAVLSIACDGCEIMVLFCTRVC